METLAPSGNVPGVLKAAILYACLSLWVGPQDPLAAILDISPIPTVPWVWPSWNPLDSHVGGIPHPLMWLGPWDLRTQESWTLLRVWLRPRNPLGGQLGGLTQVPERLMLCVGNLGPGWKLFGALMPFPPRPGCPTSGPRSSDPEHAGSEVTKTT